MLPEAGEIPDTPSKTLAAKIVALQAAVPYIHKDKTNAFHKYNYASAEAILKKISPKMVELGLVAIPSFRLVSNGDTKFAMVACSLLLIDSESGDSMPIPGAYGSGQDSGDKAIMKAQTAALKYTWSTLLNIPTGDDPEADAKTDEATAEKPVIMQPQRLAPAPVTIPVHDFKAAGPEPEIEVYEPEGESDGVIGETSENQIIDQVISIPEPNENKPYVPVLKSGARVSTFNKKIGEALSFYAANGDKAVLYWKADKTGKFKNLVGIGRA